MLNGPWKRIEAYPYYEINQHGIVRRRVRHHTKMAGTLLSPHITQRKHLVRYALRNTDWEQKYPGVGALLQDCWGIIKKFDADWVERVRAAIKPYNQGVHREARRVGDKRKAHYVGPKRKCCDCGCPTDNFRCAECWDKIRKIADLDCLSEGDEIYELGEL